MSERDLKSWRELVAAGDLRLERAALSDELARLRAEEAPRCPAHGNDMPCVVCEVNQEMTDAASGSADKRGER